MKRVIRLTESDFTSLIRRIVKESMEGEEMDIDYEKMSSRDFKDRNGEDEDFDSLSVVSAEEKDYDPETVQAVARFFKRKLRRLDDDQIEELQDMVINPETENLAEMFLREDISDRRKAFKEKAMIGGGIGMMGAGMLGMISQAMGYTDAGELMMQVHDVVDKMGGGPVSTGVLIAGLVTALKGMAARSGY